MFKIDQSTHDYTSLVLTPCSAACMNCKYWLKQSVESGKCRRRSPQVVAHTESQTKGEHGEYRESVDTYTRSEWPTTLASEWCGEYDPPNAIPPIAEQNCLAGL